MVDDIIMRVDYCIFYVVIFGEGLVFINVFLGCGGRGGGWGGGWGCGFFSLFCIFLNIMIYFMLCINEYLSIVDKGDVFCKSWIFVYSIDSLIIYIVIIYLMDMSR